MNNKKVKKFVSCVCALTLLFGAIPMNFIKAEAEDSAVGTTYYDVNEENPLQLHGVSYDETEQIFKRMDLDTAASIAGVNRSKYKFVKESYDEDSGKTTYSFSNNVYSHAREAAGGRIRFSTDSSHVSIQATLQNWYYQYATSMKDGKYGFDVYVDTTEGSTYAGTITVKAYPTTDGRDNAEDGIVQVEGTLEFDTAETRNLTIYFPITIETKSVKVGVATGSTIAEHTIPYQTNQKIVFYGSSITQGGAVTKPGNTYVNTVGRNLNMEYHSLGMWGSAKGQLAFAEYIADPNNVDTKNMTAFVFDYDHNNATVKDLDGSKIPNTKPVEWTEGEYYPFYETIRAAYPNIPIILVTRPNNHLDVQNAESPDEYSTAEEMKAFIRAAYERAKANGDENIHFVDGESFFNYSTGYLADNVHPNDAGQARMAEVMTAVLERAFAGEKNLCVEPQAECKEEKLNEDFEEGSTGWSAKKSGVDSFNFKTVAGENENNVYQLQYTRGSATPTGYVGYTESDILSGLSNFSVEMDATVHKMTSDAGDKWSYLGLWLVDEVDSKKYRYDIQIVPTTSGCKVELKDRSDGSSKGQEFEGIVDNPQLAVSENDTKFSYQLRVDVDTFIDNSGTKWVIISVYINNNDALVFKFQPLKQDFEPKTIRTYLYSSAIAGVYTATMDNVKVYNMGHKRSFVAEVPSSGEVAGTKAHYVCDLCGKKFLDADGIIPATVANLALAKSCYLMNEDFEAGLSEWTTSNPTYEKYSFDTIKKSDGISVGLIEYTRNGSASTAYLQYGNAILEGQTSYVIEMDDVSINLNEGKTGWSSVGVMLRQRDLGSGTASLEFRIQGSNSGVYIVPYYNGTKYDKTEFGSLGYIKIADSEIGSIYKNKTASEITFDLRMEVSGVESDEITCAFTVNEAKGQIVIPDFACKPTGFRISLYGGSTDEGSQTYRTTIDNIRIYTDSHTLNKVAKVESTEETAGTKVHYECDTCGKKFSNSTAAQEVTDADLKYAALNEIKCQTRVNEKGLTDIRFVAYVNDYTQYKSVKFKITLIESGKYGTFECKNVYSAVKEEEIMRTTDYLYSVDGYFAAFKLFNNTDAQLAEEMKVEVTWTDLQGNTKTAERTLTISEEQP